MKPSDPYNFNIQNYTLPRKDAIIPNEGRRRGGVCTYVKKNVPYRTINSNTTVDIQATEIKTNQTHITIINNDHFYAPPSTNLPEFLSDLEILVNSVTTPIILCGDINGHQPAYGT